MTAIVQPVYILTLPSNGAKIKFRPFTVKEEKSMLLALQEGSLETIIAAINQIVYNCTFGDIDTSTITYYDTEYIFLKIRSKSVGETIEMLGKCECSETVRTEFDVDLENLEILPKPEESNTKLSVKGTKYWVSFRHPSLEDFAEIQNTRDEDLSILANCVTAVYDDEAELNLSKEQKLEFLESMSPLQQDSLKDFIQKMPRVQVPAKYKCKSCGLDHEHILSGFENFFV